MARSARQSAQALATLAHEQGGYFTAKQAKEVGYGYRHLDYHETAGNFERVEHGLYRIPTIPLDEHDDYIRLSLWSRNQKDEPQAVVSHQTALILHDLSDLLPREIHMTVPPKFRKLAPKGVILHKATLEDAEIEDRGGYRVTSPTRTLLDVAAIGVSSEQLAHSLHDALTQGIVTLKTLKAALKTAPHGERIEAALRRKKQ